MKRLQPIINKTGEHELSGDVLGPQETDYRCEHARSGHLAALRMDPARRGGVLIVHRDLKKKSEPT